MTQELERRMAVVEDQLRQQGQRLQEGDEVIGQLKTDLATNNEMTSQIHDILVAAQGFFAVARWVGNAIKFLTPLAIAAHYIVQFVQGKKS